MASIEVSRIDYSQYSDRQLAAIPLVVLVLALGVLGGWYLTTGAPVTPGIDFTGGTEIQVQTSAPQAEIESTLGAESVAPIGSAANTYIVTFQSTDTEAITERTQQAGYEIQSIQSVSASFGSDTQRLAVIGVLVAFAGMSVLAFLLFRTFVPSIAIVVSAFSDIVVPLALMNLFGIELSLGTVAALLMLIGYSVDSDILLNNHVLRRSGGFYESAYRAMRTGVTMTITSITAMAVMAIVASRYVFNIPLMSEIGIVLVFGLVVDLMNTYLLNMSLLRWYKYEGIAR
ncbi:preprotein translocase subunit SecF [Halobacteriales archaeon QS_8_65_32]|jgi:preprotein translocase subunit SecF|nr:MAG: preprotein translocase subunit SecF [Halobacteriales archaeon QS_8_65_32]